MDITPFNMEKHYEKLNELFNAYKMTPIPPSFLEFKNLEGEFNGNY